MNNSYNYSFAKYEGGVLEFAPGSIIDDDKGIIISNPTEEQYLEYGWKKYFEDYPASPASEGKVWAHDSYVQNETEVHKTWKEVDAPEVILTYSKLKIIVAAKKYGVWSIIKQFMKDIQIEDEWNACQCITSDDPTFRQAYNTITQSGTVAKELMDLILSESIA